MIYNYTKLVVGDTVTILDDSTAETHIGETGTIIHDFGGLYYVKLHNSGVSYYYNTNKLAKTTPKVKENYKLQDISGRWYLIKDNVAYATAYTNQYTMQDVQDALDLLIKLVG